MVHGISQALNQLNRLSVKPVYNIAQGTKDDFFPFELLKDSKTITYSSAIIKGDTKTLDSIVSNQIAADFPSLVQKQDTIGGYTFGDDTDLETIMFMKNNSAYEVTQCFVQAAFCTYISADTSNGVTFDSIDFEVRKYLGGNLSNYDVIVKENHLTGFSQITDVDIPDIYIFKAQFGGESIDPSDTIGLYFKCNNTQVATNTYQSMLLPYFSYTKTDYTKTWYQSGMASHALPSFDSAAPAFKHELQNWPIDIFGSPRIL